MCRRRDRPPGDTLDIADDRPDQRGFQRPARDMDVVTLTANQCGEFSRLAQPAGPAAPDRQRRHLVWAVVGGDEAIHGILDVMNAGVPYTALQRAMPIHPTVSELIPTLLGDLQPIPMTNDL